MNTCPNCGAYIPDGAKICISCGYKPEKSENKVFDELFSNDNPYINYLQQVMDAVQSSGDQQSIEYDNSRWTAAASYMGPAFIYTYIKNRDCELVCYHANQACLLFIAWLAVSAADKLPIIGGLIKKCARLGLSVLAFTGAKNAVANKTEPVPYIGELGIRILK